MHALFKGAPRGLTETHKNVFEPRVGVSYALNDKTIFKVERRRVPQPRHAERLAAARRQSAVPAAGQRQQRLGRQPGGAGGAAALPFGMTAIDPVFKHPTAYMCSAGVQREMPLGLRRRRDLRRPARSLPAARAQHQPARRRARSRRILASTRRRCGRTRATASSGCRRMPRGLEYNALQLSADRRYRNGFKFGLAYTLSHSEDNASDKRDVLFNSFDDSGYWGNSNFDRRHVFNFYYIYDLPFFQRAELARLAHPGRMADRRLDVHAHRHAALGDARRLTSRASATPSRSRTTRSAIRSANANQSVLGRDSGRPELLVQSDGVRCAGQRHVRQRAAERHLQPGPVPVGHRASSRTSR